MLTSPIFIASAFYHPFWLCRRFEASEARVLRVVLSSFYDMSSLISRTFLEFDGDGLTRDTNEEGKKQGTLR